jgi:beta-glucanase (GH16 family)
VEQWAGTTSAQYLYLPRGGATAASGRSDAAAIDGKVLELTVPAKAGATPDNAAEVATRQTHLYGSFSSRVRTADCSGQPRTGAVTGIFTYANDGSDHNGDGIADNGELDVEILCARPWEINLTVWTDYEERSDGTSPQKRVSRVVDLRTGRVTSTCFFTSFDGPCGAVDTAEKQPASITAVPDFDSAAAYHDYRIDWSADRVLFSVSVNGQDRVLWDYRGPSRRIPHTAAAYLVNLWHTDNWTPDGLPSATAAPTAPLTVRVDSSTVAPA